MDVARWVGEITVPPSAMARTLLTWTGAAKKNGESIGAAIHNSEKLAD